MTSFKPGLKREHPNFYRVQMGLVFAKAYLGYTFLHFPDQYKTPSFERIDAIAPLEVWGVLFLISAIGTLIGVFKPHYLTMRLSSVLGFTLFVVFVTNFIVSLFNGSLQGLSAPVLWGFAGLLDLLAQSEPTTNPANRRNDGRVD